jgi:hypothetical protein
MTRGVNLRKNSSYRGRMLSHFLVSIGPFHTPLARTNANYIPVEKAGIPVHRKMNEYESKNRRKK